MRSYPADYEYDLTQWRELLDPNKKFRIGTDDPDAVSTLANIAYVAQKTTLILEECAVFFRRGVALEPWAKRIVFMGRHTECSVVVLAQRASSVPIDIRSQALRVVSFNQQEKDDVLAICARLGNKYKEKIRQLDKLQCLDNENGYTRCYSIGEEQIDENEDDDGEGDHEDEIEEEGERGIQSNENFLGKN